MPKPSEFELKLLKHLWKAKRLSAREIHDASQAETVWSYSTTRKTLDRMVDKGLVRLEKVHGIKTFAAAQSKLETLASLIKNFAENVLDSDAPLPAATFAHSKLIDADEVAALETLLEQLDSQNKKGDA